MSAPPLRPPRPASARRRPPVTGRSPALPRMALQPLPPKRAQSLRVKTARRPGHGTRATRRRRRSATGTPRCGSRCGCGSADRLAVWRAETHVIPTPTITVLGPPKCRRALDQYPASLRPAQYRSFRPFDLTPSVPKRSSAFAAPYRHREAQPPSAPAPRGNATELRKPASADLGDPGFPAGRPRLWCSTNEYRTVRAPARPPDAGKNAIVAALIEHLDAKAGRDFLGSRSECRRLENRSRASARR